MRCPHSKAASAGLEKSVGRRIRETAEGWLTPPGLVIVVSLLQRSLHQGTDGSSCIKCSPLVWQQNQPECVFGK